MPALRKPALAVFLIADGILGVLLFLIPGRFLGWLGWAPIDPIISRILGAALLAMSWGDWRLLRELAASAGVGRGLGRSELRLWAQTQALFEALTGLAVLRHLWVGRWPAMIWILFVLSVLSALTWLIVWLQERQEGSSIIA